MASKFDLDLAELLSAEEGVLLSRLKALRSTIGHPAEAGAFAAEDLRSLIRELLPAEYGVGTGVIAHHAGQSVECAPQEREGRKVQKYRYHPELDEILISPPLDLLIYDAVRSGPLARLGSWDVFPLEAVYGCVQVVPSMGKRKDKEGKTQADRLFDLAALLRGMRVRMYWTPVRGTYSKSVCFPYPPDDAAVVRVYCIVLDAAGSKPDLQVLLQAAWQAHPDGQALLDGIYIHGKAFYRCLPQGPGEGAESRSVEMSETSPLMELKKRLLVDLSRFPRLPAHSAIALDKYFDPSPEGVVPSNLVEEGGRRRVVLGETV